MGLYRKIWLVLWNSFFLIFPQPYIGNNHPNWAQLTHIFQRGGSTTDQYTTRSSMNSAGFRVETNLYKDHVTLLAFCDLFQLSTNAGQSTSTSLLRTACSVAESWLGSRAGLAFENKSLLEEFSSKQWDLTRNQSSTFISFEHCLLLRGRRCHKCRELHELRCVGSWQVFCLAWRLPIDSFRGAKARAPPI